MSDFQELDSHIKAMVMRAMEDCIQNTRGSYKCNRGPRPSGAMIVTLSNHVIYGFVRPPEGSPSCKEVDCMIVDGHCVRNLHAEVDALLDANKLFGWTRGATMYSINKPCYNCSLHIIRAGIDQIYYAHSVYDEERTRWILEAAKVKAIHVPIDLMEVSHGAIDD